MLETPTVGHASSSTASTPTGADAATRRALRKTVQMVFQNPFASLNPRKKIGLALEEPLVINTALGRAEREARGRAMLARVGLSPEHYRRYPHMFSGGQRQRVAIARALMLEPRLVVADEPVSALDVSIQAQVLNLLMDLQESTGVAYVFISHNLAVVELIADDVVVMYLGRVMERAPKADAVRGAAPSRTRARCSRARRASTRRAARRRWRGRRAARSRASCRRRWRRRPAASSGRAARTRSIAAPRSCRRSSPPAPRHAAACIRQNEIG